MKHAAVCMTDKIVVFGLAIYFRLWEKKQRGRMFRWGIKTI